MMGKSFHSIDTHFNTSTTDIVGKGEIGLNNNKNVPNMLDLNIVRKEKMLVNRFSTNF